MERSYYRCSIRLNGRDVLIICYDNDFSGIVLSNGIMIPAFKFDHDLETYARTQNLVVMQGQGVKYDLDLVSSWLTKPRHRTIACSTFLDTYNLAGDYRNSVASRNLDIEDKAHAQLLAKLFWGCNLPSVTPAGKRFLPVWTKEEVKELQTIIQESYSLLRNHLMCS
jgi:hypothetical protein